jgi:hypothetical protein
MTHPPTVEQPGRSSKDLIPQILTLRQLTRLDKPMKGPVGLFFTLAEWEKLVQGVQISKKPVVLGTVGLVQIPIPSGGILAFLTCYSGDADIACFPSTVAWKGQLVYGPCRCSRRDRHRPPQEPQPCKFSLPNCIQLSPCSGRVTDCRFVIKTISTPSGPRYMFACEC